MPQYLNAFIHPSILSFIHIIHGVGFSSFITHFIHFTHTIQTVRCIRFIHSCMHSFTHSIMYTLFHSTTIHSLTHSLIHLFQPYIHPSINVFIHSLVHLFQRFIHRLDHSLVSFRCIHSFIQSFHFISFPFVVVHSFITLFNPGFIALIHFIHSFVLFIHWVSFLHSVSQPLIHPFTHSFISWVHSFVQSVIPSFFSFVPLTPCHSVSCDWMFTSVHASPFRAVTFHAMPLHLSMLSVPCRLILLNSTSAHAKLLRCI